MAEKPMKPTESVREAGGSFAVGSGGLDREWDAFVASAPYGHLMQSSGWGEVKRRFGWEVERVTLREGGEITAGAQILWRSLPGNLSALAYVPMGPVVDWQDASRTSALLDALHDVARAKGAFCLKIEPTAPASERTAEDLVLSRGFKPSRQTVQWRSTIVIDLTGTEEDMFARADKKHRQKVRRADRLGVVVRTGSESEIPAFCDLLRETGTRKEFAAYPPDYYRISYEQLVRGGRGRLLLATHSDDIVAGIMIFILGPTAYCMYAASSSGRRDLMAPYLLHWHGLQWARSEGCNAYDYCGIPDEIGLDPEGYARSGRDDGLWGVYRFKRGFGGRVIGYTPTHDQVYRGVTYAMYSGAIGLLRSGLGHTWNRRLFRG